MPNSSNHPVYPHKNQKKILFLSIHSVYPTPKPNFSLPDHPINTHRQQRLFFSPFQTSFFGKRTSHFLTTPNLTESLLKMCFMYLQLDFYRVYHKKSPCLEAGGLELHSCRANAAQEPLRTTSRSLQRDWSRNRSRLRARHRWTERHRKRRKRQRHRPGPRLRRRQRRRPQRLPS